MTLANGVFSATEIAVLSVRKTRLATLIDGGSRGAVAVQALRNDAERFLATVQIGITVVSATAAAFGGSTMSGHLEPVLRRLGLGDSAPQVSLTLVVALVSFLSIVLGELIPKSLALRYSEGVALAIARPMHGVSWLARPLVWLLTASSNLVLRLFGDHTSFGESRLSPDELQQLVEEAAKQGSVHPRTGEIASRAFDLQQLTAEDVMVPRSNVVALARHASAAEIQRVLLEQSSHSRMPVYQGTPDHVVGYVVAKDLLAVALERQLIVLEDALRPAYFVLESMRALDILQQLQTRRILMAIVVDEAGNMAGIVTMEDLMEELVGSILSESDTAPADIHPEPDGTFRVLAHVPLRDVNRALGLNLPEGDWTTVGGYVTALAGNIPTLGNHFQSHDGTRIEVLASTPTRVKLLRLCPPPRVSLPSGSSAK